MCSSAPRGWLAGEVPSRFALFRLPRWFVLAAMAGLIARGLLLLQYGSSPFQNGLTVDDWMYWEKSAAIARGEWLPHGVWVNGPLYPYFLALLRVVFPPLSPAWVSVIQILMNWGSCLLLLPLTERLTDRRTGLAAATIGLFFAPAVFMSLKVLAITLGLLLLLGALLSLQRGDAWRWRSLAGLLFGLGVLAVPSLLLGAAAAALFLVMESVRMRRPGGAIAFALCLALTILPVTLSNYLQDGSRVLISSNYGVNFYLANNPEATGLFSGVRGISTDFVGQETTSIELARRETGRPLNKGEAARHFFRKGLAFISAQPLPWLALLGRKTFFIAGGADLPSEFSLAFEQRDDLPALRLFPLWGTPLLLLAVLAGALRESRGGWDLRYLFIAFSLGASCLIYVPANRHVLPFQFLAIPIAAAAVTGLRRGVRALPALAGALLVLGSYGFSRAHIDTAAAASAYLMSRVLAFQESGGPRLAIATYEAAAGRTAPSPMLLRVAGNAYREAGDFAKAGEAFRRAVALDPADRENWQALVSLLQAGGRESDAAGVWREWLLREPRDAQARALLGSVLVRMDQDAEAEAEAAAALAIDPASPDAHLLLGVLRLRSGETQEGIRLIERAVAIAPGFSAEAHYMLALARFQSGEIAAAREQLLRAAAMKYPVPPDVRSAILGGAPGSGAAR